VGRRPASSEQRPRMPRLLAVRPSYFHRRRISGVVSSRDESAVQSAAAMFKADIHVTLRPSILDPQGKATQHALAHLGLGAVERVRMGKYIELWIEAESA